MTTSDPPLSKGPSLKARAVALLSRREHSRLELSRKLAPHASDPETLECLLDDLARENWLSDLRYAQSLVNRQAPRQGSARILQTLRQQGVAGDSVADLADQLRSTEFDRALAIWQRKFGQPPVDARDYARQIRFLAYRGFSPELLRQILRHHGMQDVDDD